MAAASPAEGKARSFMGVPIPDPLVPTACGDGVVAILLEAGVQPAVSYGFVTGIRAAGFRRAGGNSPRMGAVLDHGCTCAKLPDCVTRLLSGAWVGGLEDGHSISKGARLASGCHRNRRSRL